MSEKPKRNSVYPSADKGRLTSTFNSYKKPVKARGKDKTIHIWWGVILIVVLVLAILWVMGLDNIANG